MAKYNIVARRNPNIDWSAWCNTDDPEVAENAKKTIEEYVMDRTKLTQADMDDIREKKKDFYIHPKEALKWGIVDEII